MNPAMCSFNKSLFIVGHKSFYSDIDIQILDEYRTIANTGLFNDIDDDIKHNLIEIDISKACSFRNNSSIGLFAFLFTPTLFKGIFYLPHIA